MNLTDALASIVNSSARNAIRRPSWGGYIKLTDRNSETGAYKLQLVTRAATASQLSTPAVDNNGTSDNLLDDFGVYVLEYSGTTTKTWTMPSATLAIDPKFWESLIADDWITGTAEDFEASRSAADSRW